MATLPQNVESRVQYLDPFTEEQTQLLLSEAREASNLPIRIPTQGVADFSPDQTQAFDLARQGIGAYEPFIDQASDLYGQAAGQYGQMSDAIGEGLGLTRRATGFNDQALQILQGMESGSQAYQDPFTEQVIDAQLADMNRQRDIARQGIAAQAVGAGAFGGGRYGIQEAELERNTAEQRNRMAAQLRSQNYLQAQQTALGVSGLTGQLGNAYGQIGGQIAGLGSQYGNIAAGQANIGSQQSQLGALLRNLGTQDVNLLGQTGGVQRQDEQARLDAQHQANIQQAYEPYQRVSFVSDILHGAPSGGQTLSVSSAPLPNPFTQALGTGLAAASLFAPKKTG